MEWWKTTHTPANSGPSKTTQKGSKRTKADIAQSTLFAFVGKKDVSGQDAEPEPEFNTTANLELAAPLYEISPDTSKTLDISVVHTLDASCHSLPDVPATPSASRVSPDESASSSADSNSQTLDLSPSQVSSNVHANVDDGGMTFGLQTEPTRRSARLKSMKVQHALKEDFSSDDEFQPRRLFFLTREEKERLKAEEEQRLKDEEAEKQRELEKQQCERLREEIKRAKEENLQRSVGRQTNPFLLPRAPVASLPIVIDGDEELVKASGVNWEDDREGTLWPYPFVSHITQYTGGVGPGSVSLHDTTRFFNSFLSMQLSSEHLCDTKLCTSPPALTTYTLVDQAPSLTIMENSLRGNENPGARGACQMLDGDCSERTGGNAADIDPKVQLAEVSGWAVQDIDQLFDRLLHRRSQEDGRKQWVDTYRPRNGREVCGNQGEVELLRRWLLESQSDSAQKRQKTSGRSRKFDSDDDFDDEEDQCGQAILLVGPSGSGKSASIYAVAEELQLQVLEINSSDKRCGRLIIDKVGEATRSQSLSKRTTSENLSADGVLANERMKPINDELDKRKAGRPKSVKGASKGKKANEDNPSDDSGSGLKAIILFEEIDVLLDHDKGFLAAVIALVQQTCVPIIMTCQREFLRMKTKRRIPVLRPRSHILRVCYDFKIVMVIFDSEKPSVMEGLGLQQLRWKRPDACEAIVHLQLIAAIEGFPTSVRDTLFLYKFCRGDFRQALMLLQLAASNRKVNNSSGPLCLEPASLSSLLKSSEQSPCLPSAVAVARGPANLYDFKNTTRFLGSDKAGVRLFSRTGSAGISRTVDAPSSFLDLLFSTVWDAEQGNEREQLQTRRTELAAVIEMSDHADALSLAASLLEAEEENRISCRAFSGGSVQESVACIVAAAMHQRMLQGNTQYLVSRNQNEREKVFEALKAGAVELVHPAALGEGRRNLIMREYVPWVRDICVAEERKLLQGSSRRRRVTHHLSALSQELLGSLSKSSFGL